MSLDGALYAVVAEDTAAWHGPIRHADASSAAHGAQAVRLGPTAIARARKGKTLRQRLRATKQDLLHSAEVQEGQQVGQRAAHGCPNNQYVDILE
eukprot:CAMPEP_0185598714 /NCGR_PEP_ID=MMETSP0434-20130131/82191_1 /TAXON_ID=626734 ORGANISM="Favella taraikaensis, Strain Fe Narragansett Bay" /NCGR_SAMPLE_ID=MMETSP0434 /ASSEMBLY_ACC=CAM_ASM_000379 /LENGTH=94 /DNA_ID=CAMNT_0028227811 /DNA_START=45 /DNA_END=329 /DNA_ORIENTATION=-